MRHAPGARRGPHVDEQLHAVSPEEVDELLRGARGVPYGQDLRLGTTNGTRTLFTYVCPLYENEPEKRYAGS
jgi:hypothetical protein